MHIFLLNFLKKHLKSFSTQNITVNLLHRSKSYCICFSFFFFFRRWLLFIFFHADSNFTDLHHVPCSSFSSRWKTINYLVFHHTKALSLNITSRLPCIFSILAYSFEIERLELNKYSRFRFTMDLAMAYQGFLFWFLFLLK